MTAALSPELAIAYVRELSADVRAAVLLSDGGEVVAGEAALAAAAAEVLAALTGPEAAVPTGDGLVVAVRGGAHGMVVACGPHALAGPHLLDARAALAAVEGAREAHSAVQSQAPATPSDELLRASKNVISATHRVF